MSIIELCEAHCHKKKYPADHTERLEIPLRTLLAPYECLAKYHKCGGLNLRGICLTVVEAGGLRSRSHEAHTPPKSSRERLRNLPP